MFVAPKLKRLPVIELGSVDLLFMLESINEIRKQKLAIYAALR